MEEKLIKKLMTSIKCGSCGDYYTPDEVEVLGHSGDMWFLKALCSACHTQCLVAAIIKETQAPEVVIDLTEAELAKFATKDKVSTDDLLRVHNFLKDFDGNFSDLFRRE